MSHPKPTFLNTYVFSKDHKMIGKQYLWTGLFFLFFGGALAMLIRWQLGFPGKALPFMSMFSSSGFTSDGVMLPDYYHMLFTMHATVIIFLGVMPLLIGAFGNFFIPLQIGADDMAFPTLNMLSYWTYLASGVFMTVGMMIWGGAKSGWFAYAPLSDFEPVSQNVWIIGLMINGVASLMGSVNYFTTILNMRAPGLSMFRLPMFTWTQFVTALLLIFGIPSLTAGLACMLLDRTMGTNFYIPYGVILRGVELDRGGGQPLLWQHLFWFFGHPEVYIVLLPGMGVTSEIISTFSRKPIYGYKAMVVATFLIGGLGFIVWGHHMFTSGMNPTLGMVFGMSTIVIAVPSAIKTFNWLGTMWRGNIQFTSAMLCAIGFVSMFIIGGLTGVFHAVLPVHMYLHSTYFVVGHFHFVMAGSALFAIIGGVYYWFPKMFGKYMDETLGKIHVIGTFILFNCVFFPMFILGVQGEPRRYFDPRFFESLKEMQDIRTFMSTCALIMAAWQVIWVINFVKSYLHGKKAPANPWKANSLEWACPSPPIAHGNFEKTPVVHRGPYEYSHPDREEDYWPQTA